MSKGLDQLLADNPRLWRGRSAYRHAAHYLSTGYRELDALLPGRGWPARALTELVAPHWGVGELRLLTPLMRTLTERGRWLLWVCPPYMPYAPALLRANVDTRYLAVIARTDSATDKHWSIEKALQSGAFGLVLGWAQYFSHAVLRRLQLAAEKGACPGVLLCNSETRSSPAALRLKLSASTTGIAVNVLKARGGFSQGKVVINGHIPEPAKV